MPPDVIVRPFEPNDLAPVVSLWNRCLPRNPVSEDRFWRLFLLDPNFDAAGALVAAAPGGNVVGFLQAMMRRVPLGSLGIQPETGWLTAFFVHPDRRRQGIGSRLLAAGSDHLRREGRTRLLCNGYAPYYLFPGVDVDLTEAHAFLAAHGFTRASEAVAMGMSLEKAATPDAVRERVKALAAEGTVARMFDRRDTLPLLAFAAEHFPQWRPSIMEGLQQGHTDIVLAADPDGSLLAFAQWENPHNNPPHGAAGRFGPFGVRPDLRSRGIGAVVFYHLVEHVRERGARYLWFGWAGGRNLPFYERAGCIVTQRFVLYEKRLSST